MENINKFDYIKSHKIIFISAGIVVLLFLIFMMFRIELDTNPNAASNTANVKEFEI